MSSPFKRPKLGEGHTSPHKATAPNSPSTGPKVQSKISSYFQKTLSSPKAVAEATERVIDALDVNEDELFDLSSFNSSTTTAPSLPPTQLSTPPPVIAKPTTNGTSTSSRLEALASLPTTEKRVAGLDADAQRELDKKKKQLEKNAAKYAFLKNPLDAMERPRSDPNYDPKTLHIPANTYYNMTDFERQYWDIKSKYFNYVVFFQKGIFYELMEGDADIGSSELGLAPAYRSDMRSVGFSVSQGDSYAERLVQRGYSVVFVVQSESPIDRQQPRSGLTSPNKNNSILNMSSTSSSRSESPALDDSGLMMDVDGPASPKNAKKRKSMSPEPDDMLRRVVDRILTPGTCPEAASDSARAVFLLSISMSHSSASDASPKKVSFGVCLVDTCSGTIIAGEMQEDDMESFTKLRTLLFHSRPREVVFTRGALNRSVLQLLKLHSGENALMRGRPATKAPTKEGTLAQLKKFLVGSNLTNEPLAITRAKKSELTLMALGLTFDFLDETKNFDSLLRASWKTLEQYRRGNSGANMILDARALENLQLIEDESRQVANSLFGLLDKTQTTFGRRMLFSWICHPLQHPKDVETRLRNVDYLITNSELAIELTVMLKKMKRGDLERSLTKATSERLPLKQFMYLIECLETISTTFQTELNKWRTDDSIPRDLARLLSTLDGVPTTSPTDELGNPTEWFNRTQDYPGLEVTKDAHEEIKWIRNSFDSESYSSDGKLIPMPGVCPQYDDAISRLSAVNTQYREVCDEVVRFYEQKGVFASETSSICITDVGNSFRLLEIPLPLVKAHGSPTFLREQKTRSTTKLARFYSPKMEQVLLPEWKEANLATERAASLALTLLNRRLASCARLWWKPWISTCAQLDCLVSLAKSSQIDVEKQKRPKIYSLPTDVAPLTSMDTLDGSEVDPNDTIVLEQVLKPFLAVSESVHPLLATNIGKSFLSSMTFNDTLPHYQPSTTSAFSSHTQIITNTIVLGELPESAAAEEDFANCPASMPLAMLLTGPNMGGKSTLLRQVCLAAIMAQIGVYPFGAVAMTTCDRIFTRIGASDNIFEGRSTFMVELEETSAVLNQATDRSLVILDELGRGTSTFDGYAIAYATLSQVALTTRCMTLFSTHYHLLTNEVQSEEVLSRLVSLFYMDALVNADTHTVTFLYKMVPGICPQSHGIMVAAMAQIPLDVVRKAKAKSVDFQASMQARQLHSPSLRSNYLRLSHLIRNMASKRPSPTVVIE